jgi:hypothetical protein
MQYALLIYVHPNGNDSLTQDEQQAVTDEYLALRKDPRVIDGAHLQPVTAATTVRVQDGDMLLTDGPFADSKEFFGGYYVVEADDVDGALEIAAKVPAARFGGAVEVRPFMG